MWSEWSDMAAKSPEDLLLDMELFDVVERVLLKVPTRNAEVFRLYYINRDEELSLKEVGRRVRGRYSGKIISAERTRQLMCYVLEMLRYNLYDWREGEKVRYAKKWHWYLRPFAD